MDRSVKTCQSFNDLEGKIYVLTVMQQIKIIVWTILELKVLSFSVGL